MEYLEDVDRSFVVLESDELLSAPETYLNQLCKSLEIRFEQEMLHWTPGPIPEDGLWARHWYRSVHASSGFEARPPLANIVAERLEGLKEEANELYDQINPYILKNDSHVTDL